MKKTKATRFIIKYTLAGLLSVLLFSSFNSLVIESFVPSKYLNTSLIPKITILSSFKSILIMPTLEELAFRSYLLTKVRKYFSKPISYIIVSSIFALLHFNPIYFLSYFGNSLIYCILKDETKNIGSCIFVHAAYNALAIAITLI